MHATTVLHTVKFGTVMKLAEVPPLCQLNHKTMDKGESESHADTLHGQYITSYLLYRSRDSFSTRVTALQHFR